MMALDKLSPFWIRFLFPGLKAKLSGMSDDGTSETFVEVIHH